MNQKYYSVDEISSLLQMHPKTVQRYIREGKIKAVKLGKAWRVTENDLNLYINENANAGNNYQVSNIGISTDKRIRISTIIDIEVEDMDEAMKIANNFTASMNNKPAEYGKSTLSVQFLESENKLRIMLWGNVKFTEAVISMLSAYTDNL